MSNVLYKTTDYISAIQATEENGSPTNLDGKVLELVVKRYAGQAALITLTSGAGITHRTQTGDDEGWADVVITDDQSDGLEAPSNHIVYVKLDGQVIVPPRYLEIVGL